MTETKNVTLRIPASIYDEILELSVENDRSINLQLIQMIEDHFKSIDREEFTFQALVSEYENETRLNDKDAAICGSLSIEKIEELSKKIATEISVLTIDKVLSKHHQNIVKSLKIKE